MIRAFLFISALWAAASPAWADSKRVTVFAAASLRGVLEEVAQGYDAPLSLSFGGSGTMARQVAAGAPADLVILANTDWMDWLVQQGIVPAHNAQIVAGNRLVVIGAPEAPDLTTPQDLVGRLGSDRLAMGQRDAVPAGIYARQWLSHVGLWDQLQGQLAETDNVRAALALVARQETPLGIVYASDATADPKVRTLYQIDPATHDPITYPSAALSPQGAALLSHMRTPALQTLFADHGFQPAPP